MTEYIRELPHATPVFGDYEVVVLGGGPAGTAAAVAAARAGRSTLLVERYGFLGGMGTAAGVTNFCGLHANVRGEIRQVVHGVADDLLSHIDALGGLNKPHMILGRIAAQAYDTAAYKIAADQMLAASGAQVLFHALACAVVKTSERRIDALVLETKSGRVAVRGKAFIDCSGDGDLAFFSGAAWEKGDAQGHLLYPSTMFRVNGVDPVRAGEAWKTIPALMERAQAEGRHAFPRKGGHVRPQKSGIEWRVNISQLANAAGHALDGTDARELSAAEALGRRQVASFAKFLQEVPGFENAYIVDIAPQVGIRETRRVQGHYMLTESDVVNCADFDDTIGVNGWPLELHVQGDVEWRWPADGSRGFNQLPYRMIVPPLFDNLWVAGRCASMTHEAQSAARVTGACFVMGQAAGAAAHLALQGDVPSASVNVRNLQTHLAAGGAFLGQGDPP